MSQNVDPRRPEGLFVVIYMCRPVKETRHSRDCVNLLCNLKSDV